MIWSALGSFAASIAKQAMDYYHSWFMAEKAKAHEWTAVTRTKQLESIVESKKVERAIKEVQVVAPKGAADWNRGRSTKVRKTRVTAKFNERKSRRLRVAVKADITGTRKANNIVTLLLIGFVIAFSTACSVKPIVFYAPRVPVIHLPDRPELPNESVAFTEREKLIAAYAAAMEARIEKYNDYALDSNERNGYGGFDEINIE